MLGMWVPPPSPPHGMTGMGHLRWKQCRGSRWLHQARYLWWVLAGPLSFQSPNASCGFFLAPVAFHTRPARLLDPVRFLQPPRHPQVLLLRLQTPNVRWLLPAALGAAGALVSHSSCVTVGGVADLVFHPCDPEMYFFLLQVNALSIPPADLPLFLLCTLSNSPQHATLRRGPWTARHGLA